MNHFEAIIEFEKEFKRLFKKYRSLEEDFEKLKKILVTTPTGIGNNFVITYSSPSVKIVKARMACRALRDRSLRVIFAYFEQKELIEFIEIYFKGEKANEDQGRIKEFLKSRTIE